MKKIVRLTEADLRNMVKTAYNKVADKVNKAWDAFEGGERKEGNPQNEEDVFVGNRWKPYRPINGGDGATYYPATRQLGLHFEHYGLDIQELVDDFNQNFYGRNVVSYCNKENMEQYPSKIQRMMQDPSLKQVEFFKFDF